MKQGIPFTLGFFAQGLLYLSIFWFLVKDDVNPSYYYWAVGLGSTAIGYMTKMLWGPMGVVGNITALIAALVFIAWSYSSVDALWAVGAAFFIMLHFLEIIIWSSELEQKPIRS